MELTQATTDFAGVAAQLIARHAGRSMPSGQDLQRGEIEKAVFVFDRWLLDSDARARLNRMYGANLQDAMRRILQAFDEENDDTRNTRLKAECQSLARVVGAMGEASCPVGNAQCKCCGD